MALTENSLVDQIEVLSTGHIQVREANQVLRDGEVIAQTFHRYVLEPNSDLTGQPDKVVAIAQAAWQF